MSLAPAQENKRLELAYFLAKFHATLLIQSACREVSSDGCSSKPGAQGFRSWGSPFWFLPPDCLFLYRIQFCTKCILRISGVSRRSVHSQFFNFPQNGIHWIWILCCTTLDVFFFFQSSNCSLSTFFSTSRWSCSYHQFVDISNDSYECICFQNCNHDTRDDVDDHTTIFFILLEIDKGFLALVARLAFGLFKLFRQSVSSLSVLKRMLAQGENFMRVSTSFHIVLTILRGMPRV